MKVVLIKEVYNSFILSCVGRKGEKLETSFWIWAVLGALWSFNNKFAYFLSDIFSDSFIKVKGLCEDNVEIIIDGCYLFEDGEVKIVDMVNNLSPEVYILNERV